MQLLIWVPGYWTPHIILSKEGFKQEYPIAIPLYSMSVAVLAKNLKQ